MVEFGFSQVKLDRKKEDAKSFRRRVNLVMELLKRADTPLNFSHFDEIFGLLFAGLTLGGIAFVGELCCYRRKCAQYRVD